MKYAVNITSLTQINTKINKKITINILYHYFSFGSNGVVRVDNE